MPQIKRNFLTVRQAAERLGVAERTVQHWITHGKLDAEPLDDSRTHPTWLISLEAIERFEQERGQSTD